MTSLVVTARPLSTVTSGYDLRVVNLCAQLTGEQHLVVVPLMSDSGVTGDHSIDASRHFASVLSIARPQGRRGWRRFLRRSEADYLRLAHPTYFAGLVDTLRERVRGTGAQRVIYFGADFAGLARAAGFRDVVVDVCDSYTLTLERQRKLPGSRHGLRENISTALALSRWRRAEADLLSVARVVTTINEADSDAVRRQAPLLAGKVLTVPNGVDVSMSPSVGGDAGPPARCVAFWGNLAFGPNREAMRFFFERVFAPFLSDSGIEVRIIGHGAEPALTEMCARYPRVRLFGFVEDLSEALRGCPVMINPMVSGSGMKNKVLEAFVRRMAVVTTSLGVEAFPDLRAGEHACVADDPAAFAAGILQLLDSAPARSPMTDRAYRLVSESYSWNAVGRRWRRAVETGDLQ